MALNEVNEINVVVLKCIDANDKGGVSGAYKVILRIKNIGMSMIGIEYFTD